MSEDALFVKTLKDWIETSNYKSMHAFFHHIRKSELSPSQVNTLRRLYHHSSSSVNDLADHLGITTAAVSQLLNPLIDKGLIVRSTSAEDRRVKFLALSKVGESFIENSIQKRHAWVNNLSEALSPSEKNQILPSLELLNDRIHELIGKEDPMCGHHFKRKIQDKKII